MSGTRSSPRRATSRDSTDASATVRSPRRAATLATPASPRGARTNASNRTDSRATATSTAATLQSPPRRGAAARRGTDRGVPRRAMTAEAAVASTSTTRGTRSTAGGDINAFLDEMAGETPRGVLGALQRASSSRASDARESASGSAPAEAMARRDLHRVDDVTPRGLIRNVLMVGEPSSAMASDASLSADAAARFDAGGGFDSLDMTPLGATSAAAGRVPWRSVTPVGPLHGGQLGPMSTAQMAAARRMQSQVSRLQARTIGIDDDVAEFRAPRPLRMTADTLASQAQADEVERAERLAAATIGRSERAKRGRGRPKGVKNKPHKRRKVEEEGLPRTVVAKCFERHMEPGFVLTDSAMEALQEVDRQYWAQVSADVSEIADARDGSTIMSQDVDLLMKRQRLVTAKRSLADLAHAWLPCEIVDELIPIARAHNLLEPKRFRGRRGRRMMDIADETEEDQGME